MNISLNATVRVKLTEHGIEHYRDGRKRFNDGLSRLADGRIPPISTEPVVDGAGFYSCELWRLFQDFGNAIGFGLPSVFENNSIEIEP